MTSTTTNRSKLTTRQRQSIVNNYKNGWTGAELANRFDVSTTTIFRILREEGVRIRPQGRVAA